MKKNCSSPLATIEALMTASIQIVQSLKLIH